MGGSGGRGQVRGGGVPRSGEGGGVRGGALWGRFLLAHRPSRGVLHHPQKEKTKFDLDIINTLPIWGSPILMGE